MSVCLFASLEIMSSGGDQQSQALTKPSFSEVQASALVESVFGLKVSKIQPLPSYDDQNFHVCIARTKVTTDGPNEYVLKISNTEKRFRVKGDEYHGLRYLCVCIYVCVNIYSV